MKKQLKSLLLVAFFACTTLPAWSQASTQGKEFWVSSSIVCSPANGKGIEPYIAISSEHACTVTITGGVGMPSISPEMLPLVLGLNLRTVTD